MIGGDSISVNTPYSSYSAVNRLAIQSGITPSLPSYHSSSLTSLAQRCIPSVTHLWYSAKLLIYSKYSIAPFGFFRRVILCSVQVIIPDNKQKQMGNWSHSRLVVFCVMMSCRRMFPYRWHWWEPSGIWHPDLEKTLKPDQYELERSPAPKKECNLPSNQDRGEDVVCF